MSDESLTPVDPTAGLTKVNIPCPEHPADYPEAVVKAVQGMFEEESTEKVWVGIEAHRFMSRRDEHTTFQELRRLGFLPTNLYTPPTEDFWNVLVTRK